MFYTVSPASVSNKRDDHSSMSMTAKRHGAWLRALMAAIAVAAMAPGMLKAAADNRPGPKHLYEGIIGEDDRIVLDATDPPFSAVGRLNVSGFSALRQCSGFLIAPDKVVTAAHCVFDAYNRKTLAPGRFHFLPGWQRQTYLAHGIGKCIRVMPGFEPSRRPTRDRFARDVAVIILTEGLDVAPLDLLPDRELKPKTALVHAGYSRDKRYVLTGDADCTILESDETSLFTDCDSNRGASGGPVMVLTEDGHFQAAAMMVGGIGSDLNVAVRISAVREFLQSARCAEE